MKHLDLKHLPKLLTLLLVFILSNAYSFTEDSTFVKEYRDKIHLRGYTSRKYTALLIHDIRSGDRWRMEPTSTLNAGVGFTYGDMTLNLAYGFGFLNPLLELGKTRYLDLQAHVYPKNWIIDTFGQIYNGFYFKNPPLNQENQLDDFYSGHRLRKFGINIQHVFNGEKLSLKSTFLQTGWQKKSAGSFLLGGEAYVGKSWGESGLIPATSIPSIEEINFIQFGPNGGYAHTFVIAKHFYVTGVFSTNIGINKLSMDNGANTLNSWNLRPNFFGRGFIGFNNDRWAINAAYLMNWIRLGAINSYEFSSITGIYRIHLVHRLSPGPKLQPKIKKLFFNNLLSVPYRQIKDK